MSRTEKNWDAVMHACDLTEEYVDFNKVMWVIRVRWAGEIVAASR